MIDRELENSFCVNLKTSLRGLSLTMSISSISDDQNVHFKFKVKCFYCVQAISDVSCILMEVNDCLMSTRVFLFNEPTYKNQFIFSFNADFLILHVSFGWIAKSWRVIFGVAESLIGGIWDV